MAHTNAWDETKPAGTDQAATIDEQMRAMKLDVRERMSLDHIWNSSTTHDGKHVAVTLRPVANTTPIVTEAENTISGSNAKGMIDLSQIWNTTGVCTAVKLKVTNTASGVGSKFLDLLVGVSSILSLDLLGNLVLASVAAGGALTAKTVGTFNGQYHSPRVENGNSGAAKTIDFEDGNDQDITLTDNVTLTFSNPVDTGRYVLMVLTGAGSFDITWPSNVHWVGDTPVVTAAAGKMDLFTFIYHADLDLYFGAYLQGFTAS